MRPAIKIAKHVNLNLIVDAIPVMKMHTSAMAFVYVEILIYFWIKDSVSNNVQTQI
jgi:hypothetical protein